MELQSHHTQPKGFALIATISVMVLLVMIALAMLSLSTIELRSSQNGRAMAEARANARMALMMAIGELQKELGPDQRISARAGILDEKAKTVEADGVANPYYLGVWESWDTWLTDKKGKLSIQDTYKRGRDRTLFRKWLVSHPDAGELETAINDALTDDMVVLCGDGSVGTNADRHVKAAKVSVLKNTLQTGSFAWWVSDESQKVRLNLQARDTPTTIVDAHNTATQTGRMGIETMTGMASFDTDPESLAKMITIGQAEISADGISENFHALTAHSLGLLTDVRSGGFKTDINLAFEASNPPDEMDKVALFGGRTFDAPIRPFNGELANITPNNPYVAPMSWRSLRDYYRLYREFPGGRLARPLEWSGDTPLTHRLLMRAEGLRSMWDAAGYNREPILLRQTWVLTTMTEADPQAVFSNSRSYHLLAIPVITLWNPYNVPLEVKTTEISTFGTVYYAMHNLLRVYLDGALFEETDRPKSNAFFGRDRNRPFRWGPNHDITANQAGYRMIPSDNNLGTMRFEPGEVRVFSTNDLISGQTNLYPGQGMPNRHFVAAPGFTPAGTNVGTLRGLSWRIDTGKKPFSEAAISFRLNGDDRKNDKFYFGSSQKSVHCYYFQEAYGEQGSIYETDGDLIQKRGYHDVLHLSAINLDWMETGDLPNAWIIEDDATSRARFPAPGQPPLPVGIISITAKTADILEYTTSGSFSKDFRNRSWLHAPLTQTGGTHIIDPENSADFDKLRADSAYQLHFTPVNGDQEVSQYLQADGRNGFFGGGMSAGNGQKFITAQDLPITPIRNLGGFSGARVAPSRNYESSFGWNGNLKRRAMAGAAFGTGVGNAYAHPMIGSESVYTKHNFGIDPGWNGTRGTNMAMHDDYWDHLFLSNEALWDSWFCSGIAPDMNRGAIAATTAEVAENFLNAQPSPVPQHYEPYLGNKTSQEIVNEVAINNAAEGENGWDLIAAHIFNKGQFNVNSSSKEAWKAFLMSMADRAIGLIDESGSASVIAPDSSAVTLARHPIINSGDEATGPSSSGAWNGIRKLTVQEVDKLAEEIVRQVKLRGPFLNMAEFINRRLTDDDLGVTGALQAAIDWDEFNSGYDGTTSGSGESINSEYKNSSDMITTLPADYPNKKAARGSRFAGIPGYVMQSDILQGIGSSLSVRGDTFVIRTYGESLTPDRKVAARAWCEAVVQRMPEYVDPSDPADKKMRIPGNLPNDTAGLSAANEAFGRKFEIVSFRWLNQDET